MDNFVAQSATWGVVLTLLAFGLGTWIKNRTGKAVLNPLLLGAIFIMVFLQVAKIPYEAYKESALPVSYILLPATVSLAIPLYEQWELLKKNTLAILGGILAGVITSLGSIWAMSAILNLTYTQYVTLLPKSVTTAIGMDVAAELGGMGALTGAVIILTGIVGNLTAQGVCKLFRIRLPMAKGVAIGTAAHAVGTAKALEMGEVEGAMSGLAIAVAGLLTALLSPVFAGLPI